MGRDGAELHQHPDGDEEQRNEDVAERHELGERLVAVIRFRNDQTREERAQGEGCPGGGGAERGEGADENDRDQEELAAARFQDRRERARHDRAGREDDADHDERRLAERQEQPHRTAGRLPGEERQHQHDRHHAEVLENEDTGRETAVRRVDLSGVRQDLQHDCGAGQRNQESEEQRYPPVAQQRETHGQRRQHREGHLRKPADQNLTPHFPQAAERELDPDREQQHDHADLGEALHILRIGHKRERIGAQQNPGDDEAGQGGELEAMENQNDQQ